MSTTTNVRTWGGTHQARAILATTIEADGAERQHTSVQVMDPVSECWTVCHSLTPAQERHVIARTMSTASIPA